MARMTCLRCRISAEAPEELAGDDLVCYRCNCYLVMEPAVVARHAGANRGQMWGTLIGAFAGLVFIPLLGNLGGALGFAIAGGVAGAVMAIILVFSDGLALDIAVAFKNGSSLGTLVGAMAVACLCGFAYGASGELVKRNGLTSMLAISGVGGLLLCGCLGTCLGRRIPQDK